MSALFQTYDARVKKMTLRERIMVCSVGIVLFAVPGFMTFVDANVKTAETLSKSNQDQQVEISRVQQELATWQEKLTTNPNKVMEEELAQIQEKMKALDSYLDHETVNLINASQMTRILQGVLDVGNGIEVQAMQSLPPVTIMHEHNLRLYRHSVSVTMRGRYLDILRHLRLLENMKYHFYWDSMDYTVEKYPYATVTIVLYTLSVNKDFISG